MDEERNNDGWILTYTGRQFWPLDPKPEYICLTDIAHALAMKCRYTGHSREFFSVAQHCILCSWAAEEFGIDPRVALLHDAAEAYLPDIATPLKHYFSELKAAEQVLQQMIFEKYLPEEGKVEGAWKYHEVDRAILIQEMKALITNCELSTYGCARAATLWEIHPWDWARAEENFHTECLLLGVSD